MHDLSIVILTYNQLSLTRQTLQSVHMAVGLNPDLRVQTIVTDNCSSDDVVGMVQKEFPWVEVVTNDSNLGFSAGNNRAIPVVKGDYVLFLNSDTQLVGGVLEGVLAMMRSSADIGIATCRVELANGRIDPASHRGFPTPWRALTYYCGLEKLATILEINFFKRIFGGYHLLHLREMEHAHEIEACTGAFLMMPKALGDKIGWWSEDYFMYGEDLDLCYRVKELGLKVMFYPEYKIIHHKHSSGLNVKNLVDDQVRKTKIKTTKAFFGAMKIFYEKHYRSKYPAIVCWIVYRCVDFLQWTKLRKLVKN